MKGHIIVLAILCTIAGTIGLLYSLGYIEKTPFSKGNEEYAINPETGDKMYCPNAKIPMKRQLYNIYVIGKVDPDHEKILPPSRIIITQENLDKNKLAWLSINSEIVGYLYTTINQPQSDVGYRGRIWFYQDQEYRMVFRDIPSNWNCENYPNAEDYGMHYRPNGARYLLKIVWIDTDKQKTVDEFEKIIYVKYRE